MFKVQGWGLCPHILDDLIVLLIMLDTIWLFCASRLLLLSLFWKCWSDSLLGIFGSMPLHSLNHTSSSTHSLSSIIHRCRSFKFYSKREWLQCDHVELSTYHLLMVLSSQLTRLYKVLLGKQTLKILKEDLVVARVDKPTKLSPLYMSQKEGPMAIMVIQSICCGMANWATY